MSKIGIMGGTFNPIHIGHVEIAKTAYKQYQLDEIWVMPNHIPAYKDENAIASGMHRLEMVRLAIRDIPYCKASDFELKREGNTYTIDTLKLLNEQYPQHSFYFIMGADSLFSFDKWRFFDEIPRFANLLVAPRDEKSKRDVLDKIVEWNQYFQKECFYIIDCKEIPCSSGEIRKQLKECKRMNGTNDDLQIPYLPQLVCLYVLKNELYI